MSQERNIIVTTNINAEIIFGVFIKYLHSLVNVNFEHEIKTISDMRDFEPEGYKIAIVYGTFWDNKPQIDEKNETVLKFTNHNKTPLYDFLVYFNKTYQNGSYAQSHINNLTQFTEIINERLVGISTEYNQKFSSGFVNFEPTTSIENKALRLIKGEILLDDIVNSASVIVDEQRDLVRVRVQNHRVDKFYDGVTCVITNSQDLFNLTHEALHELHPQIQVTVIVALEFDKIHESKIRVRFSMKSWDDNVDVLDIMQINFGKDNVGGGKSMSGGSIYIDFDKKITVRHKSLFNSIDILSDSMNTLYSNRINKTSGCDDSFCYLNESNNIDSCLVRLKEHYPELEPVVVSVIFDGCDIIKIAFHTKNSTYIENFDKLMNIIDNF